MQHHKFITGGFTTISVGIDVPKDMPQNNESAKKKKPPESVEPKPTSNCYSFSALSTLSVSGNSCKFEIGTLLSKNAEDTRKRLLPSPECCSSQFTICPRRMNLTILNSTARAIGHLHIGRFPWTKPFFPSSVKAI